MSEDSIVSPDLSMSRISLALAPASDFNARAAASCAFRSPSCCTESVVLFGPTRRLDLARNASTLASATFLRSVSISPSLSRNTAFQGLQSWATGGPPCRDHVGGRPWSRPDPVTVAELPARRIRYFRRRSFRRLHRGHRSLAPLFSYSRRDLGAHGGIDQSASRATAADRNSWCRSCYAGLGRA
jgi:hypothetical protein